ncbi:hypothetical protein J7K41_01285 [Candidatus Micrarchaeota archaeon]|nr:hypothetical protein [Candidatus Micrarchaeota archaeon]
MTYIETLILDIKNSLANIGAALSLILIILGGIVYGISQGMPAETRGKWQSMAVGLIIGGIIMAAIVGSAEVIRNIAMKAATAE